MKKFVITEECGDDLIRMPVETAGRLAKALAAYVMGEEAELEDPVENLALKALKFEVDWWDEHYGED